MKLIIIIITLFFLIVSAKDQFQYEAAEIKTIENSNSHNNNMQKNTPISFISDVASLDEKPVEHNYDETPIQIQTPKTEAELDYENVDDMKGNQLHVSNEKVLDEKINFKQLPQNDQYQAHKAEQLDHYQQIYEEIEKSFQILETLGKNAQNDDQKKRALSKAKQLKQLLQMHQAELVQNIYMDFDVLELDTQAILDLRVQLGNLEEESEGVPQNYSGQEHLKEFEQENQETADQLLESIGEIRQQKNWADPDTAIKKGIPHLEKYFKNNNDLYYGKERSRFAYGKNTKQPTIFDELPRETLYMNDPSDSNYKQLNVLKQIKEDEDKQENQLSHLLFTEQHAEQQYQFPQQRIKDEIKDTLDDDQNRLKRTRDSLKGLVSSLTSEVQSLKKIQSKPYHVRALKNTIASGYEEKNPKQWDSMDEGIHSSQSVEHFPEYDEGFDPIDEQKDSEGDKATREFHEHIDNEHDYFFHKHMNNPGKKNTETLVEEMHRSQHQQHGWKFKKIAKNSIHKQKSVNDAKTTDDESVKESESNLSKKFVSEDEFDKKMKELHEHIESLTMNVDKKSKITQTKPEKNSDDQDKVQKYLNKQAARLQFGSDKKQSKIQTNSEKNSDDQDKVLKHLNKQADKKQSKIQEKSEIKEQDDNDTETTQNELKHEELRESEDSDDLSEEKIEMQSPIKHEKKQDKKELFKSVQNKIAFKKNQAEEQHKHIKQLISQMKNRQHKYQKKN